MWKSTIYDGRFIISPPLSKQQVEAANNIMRNLLKKGVLAEYYRRSCDDDGFMVSQDGKEIIYKKAHVDYDGKRFLKYLIEHGIKPNNSLVNGEMVFLVYSGYFGILGVDNNEVYTKQYLKKILIHEMKGKDRDDISIKDVPTTIDDPRYIPTIYRYDIAKKITRDTIFEGQFDVVAIEDFDPYIKSRISSDDFEKDSQHKRFWFLPWDLEERLDEVDLDLTTKDHKISVRPIFAEHNNDGTIGDSSDTGEWILSNSREKLYWSGNKFIAAHSWLAYLTSNAFHCRGSIKWMNEKNEQGKLTVEPYGNKDGDWKNSVYIEYEGKKYLANVPQIYW